jgi:hypothetical protein
MTRKRSRAPHQCAGSRGRYTIDRGNKPSTGSVPPTPIVFPTSFPTDIFDRLEHHARAVHACVQRKPLTRQAPLRLSINTFHVEGAQIVLSSARGQRTSTCEMTAIGWVDPLSPGSGLLSMAGR